MNLPPTKWLFTLTNCHINQQSLDQIKTTTLQSYILLRFILTFLALLPPIRLHKDVHTHGSGSEAHTGN